MAEHVLARNPQELRQWPVVSLQVASVTAKALEPMPWRTDPA
jgi:hypothetical protein